MWPQRSLIRTAGGRATVLALLLCTWIAGQLFAVELSIFVRQGVAAAAVLAALLVIDRDNLRTLLAPNTRRTMQGLVAGAVMVALTYPIAASLEGLLPSMTVTKTAVYAMAAVDSPIRDATLLLLIVAAEELLWRGTLLTWLAPRYGWALGGGLSVLLYGLGQVGHGSPEIVVVALVCGLYWTLLRLLSASLWPVLVAHSMWAVTVLLVAPL